MFPTMATSPTSGTWGAAKRARGHQLRAQGPPLQCFQTSANSPVAKPGFWTAIKLTPCGLIVYFYNQGTLSSTRDLSKSVANCNAEGQSDGALHHNAPHAEDGTTQIVAASHVNRYRSSRTTTTGNVATACLRLPTRFRNVISNIPLDDEQHFKIKGKHLLTLFH